MPLRALTFNVRSGRIEPWAPRRAGVVRAIEEADADVAGLQEATGRQLADILRALPRYRAVGRGRGRFGRGEHCAILVDDDTFDVLEGGDFWLAPPPARPGSRGWDAARPRMCTWVVLRERAGAGRFTVYCTHLDHRGERSRAEGAAMIAAHARERSPAVILADLNEGSTALVDGFRSVHADADLPATFGSRRRIDHVLYDGRWTLVKASVLEVEPGASDHRPVLAVLSRKEPERRRRTTR